MMRTLDLPVHDVPSAVHFYRTVFDVSAEDAESATGAVFLRISDGVRVRVIAQDTHAASPTDREFYTRGRTPRLELRVADVEARLTSWVRAGATVRCRLADHDGGCAYAQVLDPFGHLWSFSREDEPPAS